MIDATLAIGQAGRDFNSQMLLSAPPQFNMKGIGARRDFLEFELPAEISPRISGVRSGVPEQGHVSHEPARSLWLSETYLAVQLKLLRLVRALSKKAAGSKQSPHQCTETTGM